MGLHLMHAVKSSARARKSQIQRQLAQVQIDARRALRDQQNIEKMIQQQEKSIKSMYGSMSSMMQMGFQAAQMAEAYKTVGLQMGDMQGVASLDAEKQKQFTAAQSMASQTIAGFNQMTQMTMQQMQQMAEAEIEMMRQTQLEPAKDLVDQLQTEKESLEAELQIAEQDYQAAKDAEKSEIKNFAPTYTGQA